MQKFLGIKTKEQIKMIKAISMFKRERVKKFSSKDISAKCGIPSKKFGGAFRALVNKSGDFPALLLRACREKMEKTNGKRIYIQFWKLNPAFDWSTLNKTLKDF